jgi:hypothetical protein
MGMNQRLADLPSKDNALMMQCGSMSLQPAVDPERAQANFTKIIAIRGKGLKEHLEAYRAEQAKQGNVVS